MGEVTAMSTKEVTTRFAEQSTVKVTGTLTDSRSALTGRGRRAGQLRRCARTWCCTKTSGMAVSLNA